MSEKPNRIKDFTVDIPVKITPEAINDIITAGLEGGINYWCTCVKPTDGAGNKVYYGEYASDQLSYEGGELIFYLDEPFDENDTDEYTLTLEKLKEGIRWYLSEPTNGNILTINDGITVIDTCEVDADVADIIIQYSLFGEVVFG